MDSTKIDKSSIIEEIITNIIQKKLCLALYFWNLIIQGHLSDKNGPLIPYKLIFLSPKAAPFKIIGIYLRIFHGGRNPWLVG